MSVWLEGYTEARVNGQWRCIDFFQQDIKGQLKIVPCVIGQSMVRQALEWDCDCNYVMGVPDGLSDAVRKECTDSNGVLAGTETPRWGSWYVIDGKWFDKVDFSIPEYCGFFPRQDISRQLSNPDEDSLDEEHMLSVGDYQALDAEAKKAYQPNQFRCVWLYKGKFQLVEDEYSTSNDSPAWRQPKLTGTFVQRDYDGNWQISADTSDPDFTGVDAWFNAVYEAAKTTDTNGEE